MKWFRSSGKTEDYEKEYLTRYNEQQEPKQKKNTSKDKKSIKKEPEALSTKLESAKQEYSITIGNLMNAKKELKNVKEIVSKCCLHAFNRILVLSSVIRNTHDD